MRAAWVADELAGVGGGAHVFLELHRAGVGGDGVCSAVEDERGRQAGADVVHGGKLAPAIADFSLMLLPSNQMS